MVMMQRCLPPSRLTLRTASTTSIGQHCRKLPGRGVNTSERKQCMVLGCSHKVEDDFCDKHGRGLRELFMCDACHNGSHYECVKRVGAIDELEGMLDADEGWRCRACVTTSRFGVSTLLDSLVGDDGREQLLICWYKPPGGLGDGQVEGRCHGDKHGRCTGDRCDAMADVSIGTSQDIGHDYAGLKEDLVRRQAAHTSRGADRHWRVHQYLDSDRARKDGVRHTRSWSRWDARHLDPRYRVWKELSTDQEQYEDWRWQHPALRMSPLIKRVGRWWPQHDNFTHGRAAHFTGRHTPLADPGTTAAADESRLFPHCTSCGSSMFGSRWFFSGMQRRFTVRSICGRGARRQEQGDAMLLTWLPLTLGNAKSFRITSYVRVWGALRLSLLRLFLLSYSGGLQPDSAHGQFPRWAVRLVTQPRTTGPRLLIGVPICLCYRCGSGL